MMLNIIDSDICGNPRVFNVVFTSEGDIKRVLFNGRDKTALLLSKPGIRRELKREVESYLETFSNDIPLNWEELIPRPR